MANQLGTTDLFAVIASISVIQAMLAWWIQARITNSIKHEYDKKLEKFKRDQLRKEKAAVVAEFLAEWTHLEGADTKKLNQLLWELTLYLPADIVRDVKSMATKEFNGRTAPEIIVSARNHLLDGVDPIEKSDVTFFHHPKNISMQSFPSKRIQTHDCSVLPSAGSEAKD
jgi:hypothetical protein